jgi:hypothetical protein
MRQKNAPLDGLVICFVGAAFASVSIQSILVLHMVKWFFSEFTAIYSSGRETNCSSTPRPKREYKPPPRDGRLRSFGSGELPNYSCSSTRWLPGFG